ncbi:hypothetical protein LDFHOB_03500 [Candidatus Electronema aureum]
MADEKISQQEFNLDSPQWYLNRELTWLEFNRRVLHEGQDSRTPLLERVKFLAIVGSNLDAVKGIIGKRDFFQIAAIDLPELHYPPHQPLDHFRLSGD